MFKWFFKKKGLEEIKEETKKGFLSVKKDMEDISFNLDDLKEEEEKQKKEILKILEDLSTMKEEILNLKNFFVIQREGISKKKLKANKQLSKEQTAVYAVQTAVQTPVQTADLSQFSITERAIIWILLNSDLKLSYTDLSAMLGKEKSTIRGQINTIKQKSEGLIEEILEKNGKKRVYIPQRLKESLLKSSKVRIR